MGNGVTKVSHCFATAGDISRRHDISIQLGDAIHDGLGHSFCYIRPEPGRLSDNKIHSEETTTFHSISGASVSANTSTTSSTNLTDASTYSSGLDRASTFESSDCFASTPLQPVPRGRFSSGLLPGSGPIERGFLSGPIERGYLSGPIERGGFLSGPIDRGSYSGQVERGEGKESEIVKRDFIDDFSVDKIDVKPKRRGLMKKLRRAISSTISRGKRSLLKELPVKAIKSASWLKDTPDVRICNDVDNGSEFSMGSQNLQWAQGKAGEDRVHIVISEEHGWVFVGIYDGFNGPDAPDYLLSNLYNNIHKELEGLLWNDKIESLKTGDVKKEVSVIKVCEEIGNTDQDMGRSQHKKESPSWRCEWDREKVKLDWKVKQRLKCKGVHSNGVNNYDVLKALSRALKKTEDAYFEVADERASSNPELALMGSCVLAMLMKGEDVYLMNVGDSRAVLAQRGESNLVNGKINQDLEMISEEGMRELDINDDLFRLQNLYAIQLTNDHSTYVDKEVQRIKKQHPDDPYAIMNDRVKGYLKVTRAFGVGFLKQPKWNDLLLEMFRIDYIGTSPYITCLPSLCHHKLSPRDRFLILSSDGLYQYFTSEEAVSKVDSFITAFPEGDPAQHLIEEVMFRAAKKAGMDFHELLDVPQGDRRRYHDDVSVIIISLEGRIWRSSSV